MRDFVNNVKIINALGQAATTGDRTGDVIDVRGFDSASLVAHIGTITTASDTNKFTVDMYHGDLASGTDGTTVGSTDRIGAAFDVDATTDVDKTGAFTYLGNKRYIHIKVTETGTASVVLGGVAILGHANIQPADGPDLN